MGGELGRKDGGKEREVLRLTGLAPLFFFSPSSLSSMLLLLLLLRGRARHVHGTHHLPFVSGSK
jgi:hypothetical protein